MHAEGLVGLANLQGRRQENPMISAQDLGLGANIVG